MSPDRGHARSAAGRGPEPKPHGLRIFLAVFPPPEFQRAAHALADTLRGAGAAVSWVKPDNLHYTLRFIGEVGEDGARRIGLAAREAAAAHEAFDAALGGLGAFPDARGARVIWAGLAAGGPALEAVARALEAAVRKQGFGRADHRFSAHLTLGRPREFGVDWTERLADVPAMARPPSFRVDRITVVHSQLSPKGSIYTAREQAMLGEPGPA